MVGQGVILYCFLFSRYQYPKFNFREERVKKSNFKNIAVNILTISQEAKFIILFASLSISSGSIAHIPRTFRRLMYILTVFYSLFLDLWCPHIYLIKIIYYIKTLYCRTYLNNMLEFKRTQIILFTYISLYLFTIIIYILYLFLILIQASVFVFFLCDHFSSGNSGLKVLFRNWSEIASARYSLDKYIFEILNSFTQNWKYLLS